MAMDAKESRAESALAERSSDGNAKFGHTASALQYERAKSCQDVGSNTYKVDIQGTRPCAVIGPDRVAPPARDAFPKKAPVEPWLGPDPGYRRPPDYPHKMLEYQDPTRNISPRQTFQENMQRIIMPPGYNAAKLNEDPAYASKHSKINVPVEAKYCDVPYNVNSMSSDQKNIRNADHSVSNANPLLVRSVPHVWPTGSVNVRPLRPYGAPEVYQYPDYGSCTGARPALARPHPSGHEEPSQLYPDSYYHESNIRFKPYPSVKERYPQNRYEYLGNYANPYHPPHPFAAHKYELPKSLPAHPYPGYPQVPLKYTERISDPAIDSYQRSFNQQANYGVPFRNPVIHPPYRPVPGSSLHNKLHPYPSDATNKQNVSHKLPYDSNNKVHVDYDTSRSKAYAVNDNFYLNELNRPYHGKNPILLPGYPPTNMHGLNPHPYYTKESIQLKNYEYARFKNMDPSMMNNPLTKLPMQFSPSALAISPADSNASTDTAQTHGTSHEDCGYVSQTSITSMESMNRFPMDFYGRHDYRYGPIVRNSHQPKPDPKCNNQGAKSKKDIRQFISSWSEGDEENADNNPNREVVKNISAETYNSSKQYDSSKDQEQLYVLGLVNVPSEELSKYEHIQKVSKLPENIKGYSSLELLNQFEEAIESSNTVNVKAPTKREVQVPIRSVDKTMYMQDQIPRAVSPLDVEAKISQSVIHKEVGCNFEIKPCSPKMMNVEVAAPVQTILNERVIEKVANPIGIKSPLILHTADENVMGIMDNKAMKCSLINTTSSCKMINSQLLSEISPIDNLKTNYSLHDLESNSGVCLASLPRLDNEIELSFPEVNQQFINANKTESVITTSIPKDLPPLDIEQSEASALKSNIVSADYDINYQFSPKGEKEFSRLSKYRKLKRNIPDENDSTQAKVQATRVDSVIIKNPDNARVVEESIDITCSGNYIKKEAQEYAINLASQAKNLQSMRQIESEKQCGPTSRFDEPGNDFPNNVTVLSKIDNNKVDYNKSVNVIDANQNNDMNSTDLNLPYKDVPNRYLEKATIDMPMNLSPQARYTVMGVDEDIRGNKSSDVTKQKDTNIHAKCDRISTEKNHNIEHPNNQRTSAPTTTNPLENSQQINSIETKKSSEENSDIFNTNTSKTESYTHISDKTSIQNDDTENEQLNASNNDRNSELVLKETQMQTSDDPKTENIEMKEIGVEYIAKNTSNTFSESVADTKKDFEEKQPSDQICKQNDYQKKKSLHREQMKHSQSDKKEHDSELLTCKLKKRKHKVREQRISSNHSTVVISEKVKTKTKKSKLKPSVNTERNLTNNPMSCGSQINIVTDQSHEAEANVFELLGAEQTNPETDSLNKGSTIANENTSSVKSEYKTNTNSILDCTKISKNIVSNAVNDNALTSITPENNNWEETPAETDMRGIIKTEVSNLSGDNLLDCNHDVNSSSTSTKDAKDDDSLVMTSCSDIELNNKVESPTNLNNLMDNTQVSLLKNAETTLVVGGDKTLCSSVCEDSEDSKSTPIDELINTRTWVVPCSESIENISTEKHENIKDRKIETCIKVNSYVSKELFSPRFQNLLMINENNTLKNNNFKSSQLHITSQKLDTKITEDEVELNDQKILLKSNFDSIDSVTNESEDNIQDLDSNRNYDTNESESVQYLEPINEQTVRNTCISKLSVKIQNESLDDVVVDETDIILDSDHKFGDYIEHIVGDESIQFSHAINEKTDNREYLSDTSIKGSCAFSSTNQYVSDEVQKDENVKSNSDFAEVMSGDVISTTYDCKDQSKPDSITGHKIEKSDCIKILEDETINEVNYGLLETCHDESPKESNKLAQPNIEETYSSFDIETVNETQEYCNDQSYETPGSDFDVGDKNTSFCNNFGKNPRFSLKRSLSDSALDAYNGDADDSTVKKCFMLPRKRRKVYNNDNMDESHLLNIIQTSRRNSISTVYNENSISFCILIDDNCIIEEENFDPEEINFTQIRSNSLNDSVIDSIPIEEKHQQTCDENVGSDDCITECNEDKSWVEDVGCEEIIETEDIAENIVIGGAASPKDSDSSCYESDDEDMSVLSSAAVDHTNKVKHIYGDNMCTNDAQLVDALYRTPQMDVNKKLMDRESQVTEKNTKCYDSDTLEMLLAEPINSNHHSVPESDLENESPNSTRPNQDLPDDKGDELNCQEYPLSLLSNINKPPDAEYTDSSNDVTLAKMNNTRYSNLVDSCESSLDDVFTYDQKEDNSYTSSSPEVSSTTSEEKSSSILLKISNYKGSRISEVKNLNCEKRIENSCKFTEKEYLNPNYNSSLSTHRPLLTKAAQKYIPPLRETIPNLKVKLTLPQQSLLKLKKDKLTKEEPKLSSARNMNCNNNNVHLNKYGPKKVKPKFEDVLRNIDEVQFKKIKEKNKRSKKVIPKVVIKKTENGSHYASTSSKDSFNPDLTGRKWQPWVFIEKNQFIDRMALKNKSRAVFSHRKKSFVLSEKFCKYKSISSAKFIISQPKLSDFSAGNLKYTIKLKHTY